MEHEDSFVESVEGLIETIKKLIVKPVKRITGFASVGFLLVVLLILALVFLFIGVIKIMQGIGFLLGINPYFINEYREASNLFSMKRISKIFGFLLEADKRSKGIEFDNTDQIGILNDLIYKIFKSN